MRTARVRYRPPASSALLVQRERLLDRESAIRDAKVTLVQAAAGYGKTTLLAEWYRRLSKERGIALWVPIDATIGDSRDLFEALAKALEAADVTIEEIKVLLSAEGFAANNVLVAAISDAIATIDSDVFIFLDDLHFLLRSEAKSALVALLRDLPGNAHIIMGSREVHDLPLARLRSRGELVELYEHDLRFADEETEAFLQQAGQTHLSRDDIARINASTEGWATGLRLLSLAIADGDDVPLLEPEKGSRRKYAAFFAEEVFNNRSPEVQEFLLSTACLGRVCASLANAVTGNKDGAGLLAEIESAGVFLVALDEDGQWYRYHHLFSDFLKRRLEAREPGGMARRCGEAARWFADNDLLPEAFEHAMLANDPYLAALILDRRCQSMFYSGELRSFVGLAEQLPAAALNKFPHILFTQAWLLIISWRFSEAEDVLAASRDRLRQLDEAGVDDRTDRASLQFLQIHREMMLALFTDRMTETRELLAQLETAEPISDHYILGTVYTSHLYHGLQRPARCEIDDLDAQAQQHYRRTGSIFVRIWHHSVVGLALLRRGDLSRALPALELAMASAQRLAGETSELAAIPGLLMAEVHYERDDRTEAARLIATYEELGRGLGYVDQRVASLMVAVRLRQIGKETQIVEHLLADAAALASAHGFERLRLSVAAEAARHYLLEGRLDRIGRFVRRGDVSTELKDHFPAAQKSLLDEARALLAVRLAQARGEFANAAVVASRWADLYLKGGWRTAAVRWSVRAATLEALNGDRSQARRTLLGAALHGRDAGLVRSFLDGGEVVMSLLAGRGVDGATGEEGSSLDGYLAMLVQRWNGEQGNLPSNAAKTDRFFGESDLISALDALTEREVDILRRVGNGQLNREIADAVGLTEGSVKWYLNRIYGKIGVSRRAQAVKRARQMGIIV